MATAAMASSSNTDAADDMSNDKADVLDEKENGLDGKADVVDTKANDLDNKANELDNKADVVDNKAVPTDTSIARCKVVSTDTSVVIVGRCRTCGKPFGTKKGMDQHIRGKWCSKWESSHRTRARYGGITTENKWCVVVVGLGWW